MGFRGEDNGGSFMGLACFLGDLGLGELFTSTWRIGDFKGEQRSSSSWFTVTLFGDAVGKRIDLFGWIDVDLPGVMVSRASLRGVERGWRSSWRGL